MSEELKPGDFVWIMGVDHQPFTYMVVNPVAEGVPPNIGGMTLVARWYRTESLRKVERE